MTDAAEKNDKTPEHSDDIRDLLMSIENAARMAEQGVLSIDGGQAAVEIRSLVPVRFRTAASEVAPR